MLILLSACSKKEEPQPPPAAPASVPEPSPPAGVRAGTISLGKSIGSDKKISTPAESFAKNDTIYVSVETVGSGTAVLKAKWTYSKGDQSTVVKDDSQTIMPTGPATSEFHISKPDGWPAGDYHVELALDDRTIGEKTFTVK
jgi:hypothetical protein